MTLVQWNEGLHFAAGFDAPVFSAGFDEPVFSAGFDSLAFPVGSDSPGFSSGFDSLGLSAGFETPGFSAGFDTPGFSVGFDCSDFSAEGDKPVFSAGTVGVLSIIESTLASATGAEALVSPVDAGCPPLSAGGAPTGLVFPIESLSSCIGYLPSSGSLTVNCLVKRS